jgi:hypothetical protein
MHIYRCLILIPALVLMVIPSFSAWGQDEEDDDEELKALRAEIQKAKDPKTSALAYRKFFEYYEIHHATGNVYHKMRSDPDNIIALQAAYQLMLRRPHPPELAHHRQFIGFLEGRTGLNVPYQPGKWRLSLIWLVARDHPENGLIDKEVKQAPKLASKSRRQGTKEIIRAEGFILENLESIEHLAGQVILKQDQGIGRVDLPEKLFQ